MNFPSNMFMYYCNDYFRLLRRVYESGRAGDPNVMEELADLIGPELGTFAFLYTN